MAIRQLAGDCTEDDGTCPGVWADDTTPNDVIVVGSLLDPSPIALGEGEVAIRLPRRFVHAAAEG